MSVIRETSFRVDDIIKTPKSTVIRTELKPEELLIQLRQQQQAKKNLEDEVKATMLLKCAKKKEEDAVTAEALKLEGTLNEKEGLNTSLQLKCDELQLEAQRQLEQNHQKEELVKQYYFQIQEIKLKHRKIRMNVESQLQQLMEQHKNLSIILNPKRLPAEIQSAEYNTEQLLKAEQEKLVKLAELLDELNHTQNAEEHMDTSEKAP